MVTTPIALLAAIGIFLSFTKGKGSAWFGFLCITFGIAIAGSAIGATYLGLLGSGVQLVINLWSDITS